MEKKKYHPILFSTPIAQAILEDRKTQTRRTKGLEEINKNPDSWIFDGIMTFANVPSQKNDFKIFHGFINLKTGQRHPILCPYEIGDVLWVRETYQIDYPFSTFCYKADGVSNILNRWKPSIFMPKEACRIFLKIKSVRVERLQEISEIDSRKEGVIHLVPKWKDYNNKTLSCHTAYASFKTLWISINKEDSWDFNPFVWVYEFEQIEKPNDFC